MKLNPHKPLATKPQIANHLGVSVRTITNLQQTRAIPHIKIGRLVRFDLDDCTETLKQNNQINHINYNTKTSQKFKQTKAE